MDTIGEQLRRARVAQGFSIDQIEEITLISARHLEAIERGTLDSLPRPYIRAFVREYAAIVGLDPAALLRALDEDEAREAQAADAAPAETADAPEVPRSEPIVSRVLGSSRVRIASVATLLLAAAVTLVMLSERRPSPDVREVPFENVISENEQRLAPPQQPAAGSSTPGPRATDSLTLSASVTDSLWMQVSIDNMPPREYLAPPGFRASWRAETRFLITAGNAGAATWTLNGKSLGTLGKAGVVIRNVEVNRTSLTGR